MDTIITITGFAVGVNYPAEIIKQALERAGIPVIYKNPNPPENLDEYLYNVMRGLADTDIKPIPITLIVNHEPWPG